MRPVQPSLHLPTATNLPAGRPAIEGVRTEEKEKEWSMQVTTLRDEADLLRSQVNDSRLLKAKVEKLQREN